MRVWLTSFVLLFGAAELLQWMRQFSIPLPIFVLGGVFLAVASNYDKLKDLPFHPDYEEPESLEEAVTPSLSQPPVDAPVVRSQVTPISVSESGRRPISFTIRRPFHPGD